MSYGFSLATTVVLLVNYGLSVSQSFLFAQQPQMQKTTTRNDDDILHIQSRGPTQRYEK